MARIAGIDLPRNKRVVIGLTTIFGIGVSTSKKILGKLGINVRPKQRAVPFSAKDNSYTPTNIIKEMPSQNSFFLNNFITIAYIFITSPVDDLNLIVYNNNGEKIAYSNTTNFYKGSVTGTTFDLKGMQKVSMIQITSKKGVTSGTNMYLFDNHKVPVDDLDSDAINKIVMSTSKSAYTWQVINGQVIEIQSAEHYTNNPRNESNISNITPNSDRWSFVV